MADAKKCDRCGKYFDVYEFPDNVTPIVVAERYGRNLAVNYEPKDLCQECQKMLTAFMNDGDWKEQNEVKDQIRELKKENQRLKDLLNHQPVDQPKEGRYPWGDTDGDDMTDWEKDWEEEWKRCSDWLYEKNKALYERLKNTIKEEEDHE